MAAPGRGMISAGGRAARLLASHARAVTPGTLREASGHVRSHVFQRCSAAAPSRCPYVPSLLPGVRLTPRSAASGVHSGRAARQLQRVVIRPALENAPPPTSQEAWTGGSERPFGCSAIPRSFRRLDPNPMR